MNNYIKFYINGMVNGNILMIIRKIVFYIILFQISNFKFQIVGFIIHKNYIRMILNTFSLFHSIILIEFIQFSLKVQCIILR